VFPPSQPDIPANSKVVEVKHLMIKPYRSALTNLPAEKKAYVMEW
jgi:hypothetical protein